MECKVGRVARIGRGHIDGVYGAHILRTKKKEEKTDERKECFEFRHVLEIRQLTYISRFFLPFFISNSYMIRSLRN